MNWRELPFIRLLVPCLAGILSAYVISWPMPQFTFMLLALCLLSFLFLFTIRRIPFRWRSLYGITLQLALFLLFYQHLAIQQKAESTTWAPYFEQTVSIQGVISSIKQRSKGPRLVVQVQWMQQPDTILAISSPVLLYLPKSEAGDSLQIGDHLQARCRLTAIAPPSNPHAFNFKAYMAQRGIYAQGFVRTGNWSYLPTFKGSRKSLTLLFAQWQAQALAKLQKHLPTPATFAVGAALLLGDKSTIPEELKMAYANTGAMHVLAVSGLHVGIVYLMILSLLRITGLQKRQYRYLQLLIVLLAIWSFALLTGGSPSVLRAATMFSFFAIGKALQRPTNVYNTLAASAFLLLLLQPQLLFQVGFQLSYLAVVGIVFFQPRIYQCLFFHHRLLDYAWQLTSVGVAAQLMTLPISLFYFHQFPTYFWLSGLLVIPAAMIILGLGFLLFLSSILPWLEAVTGTVLYYVIWGVNQSILAIQDLPFAVWENIYWPAVTVLLVYVMIGCWMAALAHKKFRYVLVTLALANISIGSLIADRWQKQSTPQLIIYQTPKQTLIDIKNGSVITSLQSIAFGAQQLVWTAQPFRLANAISQASYYTMSDTIQTKTIRYRGPLLQTGDTTIGILSPEQPALTDIADPSIILVRADAPIDLASVFQAFPDATFVFDGSNRYRTLRSWQKQCKAVGGHCHFTPFEGAFQYSLQ